MVKLVLGGFGNLELEFYADPELLLEGLSLLWFSLFLFFLADSDDWSVLSLGSNLAFNLSTVSMRSDC